MFQFTRFPLPVLCVQTGVTPHDGCRVSPFRHPRIKAWSAAPRGFSQPPTSFFGSRRQGIHRWLFVAWKNKDARARYAVLKGLVRPVETGQRRNNTLAENDEGGVERPFRTEQRTERPSSAIHREDYPAIGERCSRTQLANASTWESPSRGGKDWTP